MGDNAPTAVVFDIGAVLLHWEPERVYRRLIPDAQARARFFRDICPPAWNETFDRGAPMPQGVVEHAERHPDHADLILAWWADWPEMIGPAIDGSVACLKALKARGTPVYGLTNFAAETFEIAREMYPFLDDFDVCVVSAHVKRNKPEPEIYAALEAQTGAAPHTLFFTDDRPDNIAAAVARGWHGHVFEHAEGLQAALIGHGLLTREELQ
ncbi:MAG: haloacid dehalogenase [Alphaproteobacteria bacterium HGW-Alphaproteobacteria-10]|nr:MAG: haloacid dehalogenase [Alphaproteobacteria bacterium HGW-Alphaproteobacteria-10]